MNIRYTLGNALIMVLAILAFGLSLVVAPYHVNGDQVHYTKAYEAMRGLGLFKAFHAYRSIIFSFEPVHFFVSWGLVNLGFDKTISMAGLNGLLAALFGQFLLGRTRKYVIIVLLVLSNQYMYAMFFTLEKLKISIILLLICLNYKKRLFGLLAGFTHLQTGFLFLIYFSSRFLSQLRFSFLRKLLHPRNFLRMVLPSLIAAVGVMLFFDYGLIKIFAYINRAGVGALSTLVPALIVFAVTFFTTDQSRAQVVWYFSALTVAIFLIGGDRLNMFAIFGFLYFTNYRLKKSPGGVLFLITVFTIILYLGYKSYIYLNMVVTYGG